jgi:hypothetical protein
MMHGHEKSDPAIVAGKPTNKAERSAAELVERRAGTEGNSRQLSTRRTPSRVSVTQDVGSSTAPTCRRLTRVPTTNYAVCCAAASRHLGLSRNNPPVSSSAITTSRMSRGGAIESFLAL